MTKLEDLVQEISRFEAIISEWDESQRGVVVGLKRAIEALHKEALVRLIKSVKQESMPALRHAVQDEVVYGVMLYHELVKPPIPPFHDEPPRQGSAAGGFPSVGNCRAKDAKRR